MNLQLISLILFSVGLSAGSQIALKQGMIAPRMQDSLASGNMSTIVFSIITSPMIIGGLFSFGLSAIVWLFVLSRVPLSSAYPFVSLGIAVTVIAGMTLFGESVSMNGAIGVALIILGILFVASQA